MTIQGIRPYESSSSSSEDFTLGLLSVSTTFLLFVLVSLLLLSLAQPAPPEGSLPSPAPQARTVGAPPNHPGSPHTLGPWQLPELYLYTAPFKLFELTVSLGFPTQDAGQEWFRFGPEFVANRIAPLSLRPRSPPRVSLLS